MSIDKTEIEAVAWLSRLAVTPEEAGRYRDDLSRILALVEQLQAAATEGVEPLAHPLELEARLRPDEVTEGDDRERFQAIAPAVSDGHYVVPRVIE